MTARVYAKGRDIEVVDVDASAAVLISDPVVFRAEFRAFIVERRVAAFSPYVRDGEVARDDDGEWSASPEELAGCRAFLETLVGDSSVALPAAVVVDAGLLEDGAWAVVEANAGWASGICGCDPSSVLDVLRRASVRAGSVPESDLPWLRSGGD
jgi:hypothetical protein